MTDTHSRQANTRLDVITGFLGAGKTTFLGYYTRWLNGKGISYCIIENEFGKAGIDADILADTGAKILEISGGCVCCTLKVTLYDMLRELCGKVERVLLEPSGLFCGDDLLDIIHSPDLEIEPGFWVGIVDPIAFPLMTEDDRDVLRSELIHAGSILISKADMLPEKEADAVCGEAVRMLPAPEPLIFRDIWREAEPDSFFSAIEQAGCVIRPHERKIYDHTGMFQSACIAPKRVFTEEELQSCLTIILNGGCGEILRIKGCVQCFDGCRMINCTPGCISAERTEKENAPVLNIIGRNLQRKQINTILS